MSETGKVLLVAGVLIAAAGLLLTVAGRIPFLGRLPGDIVVERRGFRIYLPVATSLVLSILLTMILRFFRR